MGPPGRNGNKGYLLIIRKILFLQKKALLLRWAATEPGFAGDIGAIEI